MKKQIIILVIWMSIILLHHRAFAQATFANNNNGFPDYLGGNVFSAKALDIGQENPLAIDFYTNGGPYAPGFLPLTKRINIFDAPVMPNIFTLPGFMGVGDVGIPFFSPLSRLHLHDNATVGLLGREIFTQWTNVMTGPNYVASNGQPFLSGFRVGINESGFAQIRQQMKRQPIQFFLNSDLVGFTFEFPSERMIMHAGTEQVKGFATENITRVAIWENGTATPGNDHAVSLLQLGNPIWSLIPPLPSWGPYGYRDWMDNGLYINQTQDNMYIGESAIYIDQNDAVINWGDGQDSPANKRLLFLYTKDQTAAGGKQAGLYTGLEFMRMHSDDMRFGKVGIGGYPVVNEYYDCVNATTSVDPGNTLEVNSPDDVSIVNNGGGTGFSGLRFTDLRSTCIPYTTNPGPGILSLDECGDVIYVPSGNSGIGNYCGNTQYPMSSDFEILLNGFDYYLAGQGLNNTDVIVGAVGSPPCINPNPFAKFQSYQYTNQTILGSVESNAGLFWNSTSDKMSIGAVGRSEASPWSNIGLKGVVRENRGKNNTGVFGTTVNAAGFFAGNINVGVYGFAQIKYLPTGFFNYGVVGDIGIACPIPPCGATGPDAAGYFNGDIQSTTAIYVLSDSTLKENIQDIINPMDVINSLNPKSYTFKQQANRSIILPDDVHYGLLAQELESVLPGAVKNRIHPARYDSLGNQTYAEINFKGVNNMEVIPFLIAAVKEQHQTIQAMQAQLDNCCNSGNRHSNPNNSEQGNSTSIDVELKNSKSIILNQNVPNPFAEQTTISYFLTDDVREAQIFFYDNKGVILKIVDVNEKGTGQLNVYAADLSSGSYTYSLIADGKLIETKKMVKTN